MNILQAMDDPAIFGKAVEGQSYDAWRAFFAALFGLPLDDAMLATWTECTGRKEPPTEPSRESWLVFGRRGGKSFAMSILAVHLAVFRDYRPYLSPGEIATIMLIAADRKQARTVHRYIVGLLEATPMLRQAILRQSDESVELSNRVSIEIHTANFRTVRGYTIAAAICDEIAFWKIEGSTSPDTEIINALRPAMATIPDSLLICASSPYARRGSLWGAYKRYFGKASPVLIWQASSRTMNPGVPQSLVDAAMAEDGPRARSEYLAQFREDIEAFVSIEQVEAATDVGVKERPPLPGVTYTCFVDPSGGRADSMTMAIAHKEGDSAIIDLIAEKKAPFNPEVVAEDFAKTMKRYRVSTARADRYAAEWTKVSFARHGIRLLPADKPKSDLYTDLLPPLNSGLVRLLDHPAMAAQLVQLERRTSRGGRDSIDHSPGGHDDLANSVAGAVHLTLTRKVARPLGLGLPLVMENGIWTDFGAGNREGKTMAEILDEGALQ